jgi:hypothetical protein
MEKFLIQFKEALKAGTSMGDPDTGDHAHVTKILEGLLK